MEISRKTVLFFLAGVAAVVVSLAIYSAFTPPETYVIGYINPNPTEFEGAQGFLRNLPKYGFVDG